MLDISKVKEAAKRCQEKRNPLKRLLLADRDANELKSFANDIKEAVTTFKASYCLSPQTSALY